MACRDTCKCFSARSLHQAHPWESQWETRSVNESNQYLLHPKVFEVTLQDFFSYKDLNRSRSSLEQSGAALSFRSSPDFWLRVPILPLVVKCVFRASME